MPEAARWPKATWAGPEGACVDTFRARRAQKWYPAARYAKHTCWLGLPIAGASTALTVAVRGPQILFQRWRGRTQILFQRRSRCLSAGANPLPTRQLGPGYGEGLLARRAKRWPRQPGPVGTRRRSRGRRQSAFWTRRVQKRSTQPGGALAPPAGSGSRPAYKPRPKAD